MSRLLHSYSGYLRSMQMSSTALFVFVEGKQSDPFFYAKICETFPLPLPQYEICLAQELPGAGGGGGKPVLLGFFAFLRKSKALITSLAGQDTACIFFLDKDIDDLQHKMKRSDHVIYTSYYDVQNYIFLKGDLLLGAASAASIDPARLRSQFSDAPAWCQHVVTLWREWISLCLRMLEDGISSEANYGVASRVQTRPSGPVDAALCATLTTNLARRCGLPVAVFRQKLASTMKKVDRYISKQEHHRIFKGKWFALILADHIDSIMAGQPYDRNGLAARLPSAIAATIDFSGSWADHFRDGIQKVLALM